MDVPPIADLSNVVFLDLYRGEGVEASIDIERIEEINQMYPLDLIPMIPVNDNAVP